MIQLQKAKRSQVKVKLALAGVSGSGKTMSSLLMAYGIVKAAHPDWSDGQCWEKICIIDTENGSASLYANHSINNCFIGEFFTIPMKAPFEPAKYIDSIHAAEQAGIEVLIIDSMSAAWAGEGGSLEKVGKIAARTGNSYTAWRDVTPEHNRLIDTILQSTCHVICNFRAKQEYLQTKDNNGRTVIKNMGLGLQFRDSVEYELSTLLMIDSDHVANATKDRTGLFDGKYFTITPETGKAIYQWLASGAPETTPAPTPVPAQAPAPAPEQAPAQPAPAADPERLAKAQKAVTEVFKAKYGAEGADKPALAAELTNLLGGVFNPMECTDIDALTAAYMHFKD